MKKDNRNGRRITIERISVTRIRTRGSEQKFFCNVCGREVEAIVAHDAGSEPCVIVDPHDADAERGLALPAPEEKN